MSTLYEAHSLYETIMIIIILIAVAIGLWKYYTRMMELWKDMNNDEEQL
jgi:hypothetical protein